MYRQYEDPRKLEEELARVKEEYQRFLDAGGVDEFGDWYERISDLEDRINFAWQDEEYDENYMRENYGDEQWMEENVYSATDADPHYFYRITVGSNSYWANSYVIETDHPTTDYGALVDILIDYMVETEDSHILDMVNEYEWDADYVTIHPIGEPDWTIYPDEFVQGGNAGDVLIHHGDFRIDEISVDEITEDDIIVPEVW